MKWFLGVSVEQSPGVLIILSQKSYFLDFLSCFGMCDCNLCDLPMTAITRNDESSCVDLKPDAFKKLCKILSLYTSVVGKLKYLSGVFRSNLSYVVSYLYQVLKSPSHNQWLLAENVLRYLNGTLD